MDKNAGSERALREFTPGLHGMAYHRRVFGICEKEGNYTIVDIVYIVIKSCEKEGNYAIVHNVIKSVHGLAFSKPEILEQYYGKSSKYEIKLI